jgi:uncharacterized protein involved in exopolysaccharide biosynthesis
LDILRRNVRWVIAPAFLGLVVATLVAFWMDDVYVSSALIRIVPQQVPESLVQNAVNQQLGDRINAMAETIESRTTLSSIINANGLYKNELKREPLDDVIAKMQHSIHIAASLESPIAGAIFLLSNYRFPITTATSHRRFVRSLSRGL